MKFKRILGTSLLCALMCTNFASSKINAEELNTVYTPFSILANEDIQNALKGEVYSLVSESESVLPDSIKTIKVLTKEDLKLRKSANEESEVIKVIPKGTEVTVTFSGDKWSDISFDGETGIVSTDYLEEKEVLENVNGDVKIDSKTEVSDNKSESSEIKEISNAPTISKSENNTVIESKKPEVKETPKVEQKKETVKEVKKTEVKEAPKVEYKTISLYTTDNLNARSSKSASSNIITVLSKGSYLTGKDHGEWLEISVNNKTAYVMKKYLSEEKPVVEEKKVENAKKSDEVKKENLPQPNQSAVETMIEVALSQVGKPYLYASANPSAGFDCSGLTYYAFSKVGVMLGRSSSAQFGYGTPIPKSEIKRGDLLFFSNGSGIGHVGIYLGNGKMVHSSTYDTGVIVSSIDSGYYVNNYAGARRILK